MKTTLRHLTLVRQDLRQDFTVRGVVQSRKVSLEFLFSAIGQTFFGELKPISLLLSLKSCIK